MGVDAKIAFVVRQGSPQAIAEKLAEQIPGAVLEARGKDVVVWSTLDRFPNRFPRGGTQDRHLAAVLGRIVTDLPEIAVDPRGFFVYPDVCSPEALSYDGIVREIGDAGVFLRPLDPGAVAEYEADFLLRLDAIGRVAQQIASASEDASTEELLDGAMELFTSAELERLDAAAKRDNTDSFREQVGEVVRGARHI
jgi:hypothetical protein